MKAFLVGLFTALGLIVLLSSFFVSTVMSLGDLDSTKLNLPARREIAIPDQNVSTTPRQHQVIYKIEANKCSGFDLTYTVPDGTSQTGAATCRNGKSVEVARFTAQSAQFLYLSVQNVGGYSASSSTTFSCNIYVDNVLFRQVESYGEHRIASCDGRIP